MTTLWLQRQELRCGSQVQHEKVSVDFNLCCDLFAIWDAHRLTDPLTGIIPERINVRCDLFDVAVDCRPRCIVNDLPMSVSACEQQHCHHTLRSRLLKWGWLVSLFMQWIRSHWRGLRSDGSHVRSSQILSYMIESFMVQHGWSASGPHTAQLSCNYFTVVASSGRLLNARWSLQVEKPWYWLDIVSEVAVS